MYEFFMFLVVLLGIAACIAVIVWALRFLQFVRRGFVLRQQKAYIRRLESYWQDSHDLLTRMLVSSGPISQETWNKITDLQMRNPKRGDQ